MPITIAEVPPKLASALVEAQRAARSVSKKGTHPHHGYRYTSAEQMLAEVGPALAGEGLALLQISQSVGEWSEITIPGRHPKRVLIAPVTIQHLLVHESGEALILTSCTPSVVDAGRTHEKAVFGTRTEAIGYAIRDVTAVARGGETDVSGRVDAPPVVRSIRDWVGLACDDAQEDDLNRYHDEAGRDPKHACEKLASFDARLSAEGHRDRILATLAAAAGMSIDALLDGPDGADVRVAVALIAGAEILNIKPAEDGSP